MSRKRRQLAALIFGLIVVGVGVYRHWLGAASIPVAWVALIAGPVAASLILRCPGCGQRLGSIFQTACAHCGVLLTDQVRILPAQQGPVDPGAAAYMAKSRRILQKWARVRRVLRWSVPVAGLAGAIGFPVAAMMRPNASNWQEAVGVGLFIGVVMAAAAWLILTHLADNAFGLIFMAFRGRCPVCHAWFSPPSTVRGEAIVTDYGLPKFCASCGAKLE